MSKKVLFGGLLLLGLIAGVVIGLLPQDQPKQPPGVTVTQAEHITSSDKTVLTSKSITKDPRIAHPAFSPDKNTVISKIKNLHVPFVANQGQAGENVKFYARTFGGTVFVTEGGEIVYSLSGQQSAISGQEQKAEALKGLSLKEQLIGAKVAGVKGEGGAVTKVSYFRGNDPSKWVSAIPTYDFVNLGEVYDGIELKLKAYGNNVEKLFYVKPGAESANIQVRLDGATGLSVNDDGELVVETEKEEVRFTKPVAYQEIDGKRTEVAVQYVVANPQSPTPNPQSAYSFIVGDYDKSKELVIDPLLASTFFGGEGDDNAHSLASDSEGNIYVAGVTSSSNLGGMAGAYDSTYNEAADSDLGRDAFIAKFDSDLTTLLAFTYIGGKDKDTIRAIELDSEGNIYAAGITDSSDFPVTINAYDTECGSDGTCDSSTYSGQSYPTSDSFILKLSGDLKTLLASTFLGGHLYDRISSLSVGQDSVYVTGSTSSADFPVTEGAYNSLLTVGYNIFITKLNSDLSAVLSSTYMGGIGSDQASSIRFDKSGNVFVAGHTQSLDFPTTPGAYDTNFHSTAGSGFVVKLNGELTSLVASTFLGGNIRSIALDSNDNVYAAGEISPKESSSVTYSSGAYAVYKLSGDLMTVYGLKRFGGSKYANVGVISDPMETGGMPIGLDSQGNVYVAGTTATIDFPVTPGAYDTVAAGQDGYVIQFNNDLTEMPASTYLGGDRHERILALLVSSNDKVYVAGPTDSSSFPVTSAAFDRSFNNIKEKVADDIFISKFDPELSLNHQTYALTISKTGGNGMVTSKPAGVACGEICTGSYIPGKKIRLSARPDPGYGFQEWGGVCSGKQKCEIIMDSDKNVEAVFFAFDPKISLSSDTLDLGTVKVNTISGKKGLIIKNKGKGILTITDIKADSTEFYFGNWNGQEAILPNKSFTLQTFLVPTSAGQKTSILTITSNDPDEPTKMITLKGGADGLAVQNEFAGHYTGTYYDVYEGTLSFLISTDGKVLASVTHVLGTFIGIGQLKEAGEILINMKATGETFYGTISSQNGKLVASGQWGACPNCIDCGMPCWGGSWTAQKD